MDGEKEKVDYNEKKDKDAEEKTYTNDNDNDDEKDLMKLNIQSAQVTGHESYILSPSYPT